MKDRIQKETNTAQHAEEDSESIHKDKLKIGPEIAAHIAEQISNGIQKELTKVCYLLIVSRTLSTLIILTKIQVMNYLYR